MQLQWNFMFQKSVAEYLKTKQTKTFPDTKFHKDTYVKCDDSF